MDRKTAPTAVWWDINFAPVPYCYDVRPLPGKIRRMIRRFGWGGPVTITAIGNLKQTLKKSPDVVRGLYTGGMSLKHLGRGFDSDYLFDIVNDIMVWKEKNPPPACIMLISDRAEEVSFYFGLLRDIGYYTIGVYDGDELLPMESCGKHRRNEDIPNNCWDDTYNWQRSLLLTRDLLLTRPPRNVIYGYSSPGWVCKVCEPYGKSFDGLKFGDFTTHLKSRGHALSEIYRPERIEDSDSHPDDASSMTLKKKSIGEEEGRMKIHSLPLQQEDQMSLPLQQEVARVAVWWDINSCPVPKNFDARRVRPIIKSKLESLGYSCPITITAIGNLRLPFKKSTGVLKAIFSTGVFLLNVPSGFRHIWSQLLMWKKENPPPATLMLISSDSVEDIFGPEYTIHRAVPSSLPPTNDVLVWETLLEDSESQALKEWDYTDSGWSCTLCELDGEKINDLTTHFSSRKHALRELDEVARPVTRRMGRFLLSSDMPEEETKMMIGKEKDEGQWEKEEEGEGEEEGEEEEEEGQWDVVEEEWERSSLDSMLSKMQSKTNVDWDQKSF